MTQEKLICDLPVEEQYTYIERIVEVDEEQREAVIKASEGGAF